MDHTDVILHGYGGHSDAGFSSFLWQLTVKIKQALLYFKNVVKTVIRPGTRTLFNKLWKYNNM